MIPISFSCDMAESQTVTRAGTPLSANNVETFKVWAYKRMTDGGMQTVMPGFTVNYLSSSAKTTSSNTSGWEYVAQGPDQTIKYWDWGAADYRFFAIAGTYVDDGTGDEGVDDDESATDYTDDVDGDGAGDTAETSDGTAPQNQPDEGANDEKLGEKRKKYVMYTRFIKLHNTIDSFITKLHAIVKDDVTENAVIKIVSNNLIALKNNIYEYMVAKYKDASYVEIHIFYETAINCVRLNFSLLATNNINIQNN